MPGKPTAGTIDAAIGSIYQLPEKAIIAVASSTRDCRNTVRGLAEQAGDEDVYDADSPNC
jgi:hypothetical protein